MSILAAIELNAETIGLGAALLANVFQAIRGRNVKKALDTVIDGVEIASRIDDKPKNQIALRTVGTVAESIINSVLTKKGYRKKTK